VPSQPVHRWCPPDRDHLSRPRLGTTQQQTNAKTTCRPHEKIPNGLANTFGPHPASIPQRPHPPVIPMVSFPNPQSVAKPHASQQVAPAKKETPQSSKRWEATTHDRPQKQEIRQSRGRRKSWCGARSNDRSVACYVKEAATQRRAANPALLIGAEHVVPHHARDSKLALLFVVVMVHVVSLQLLEVR
jgi:hypothetical protein